MRFWTIWTLPGLHLPERLRRTRDWSASVIAWHLPKRIRYWVTIQEIGRATMTSKDVMATPLDEVLKNLDRPKVTT